MLRLLLKPSFHPELCITMSRATDETRIEVVALRTSLWHERTWRVLPTDRAELRVAPPVFDEIVSSFEIMRGASEHGRTFLDGMAIECCSVSGHTVAQIQIHVFEEFGVAAFVRRALETTWQACREPRVANAVAQAAFYVGMKYSLKEVPVERPPTRLMVLGEEQERHEYLEMLKTRKEALKQGKKTDPSA